jgi:hypothetical protein
VTDLPLDADLPAPRDDDPPSLRQDILDELADHLDCAVRREVLVGGDGIDAAKSRALARFGNLRAVARQLWFEALQDRLMSARLTLVAICLLTLVCLGLGAALWQMQTAQRELADAQHAQSRELLDKLTQLIDRPQPTAAATMSAITPAAPSEWNRLTVKCVRERQDGAPVQGVRIRVVGRTERARDVPDREGVTNDEGMADLGLWPYGSYSLIVESEGLFYSQPVDIHPGEAAHVSLVCPRRDAFGNARLIPSEKHPLSDRLWVRGVVQPVRTPIAQVWTARELSVPFIRRPDGKLLVGTTDVPNIQSVDLTAARKTEPENPAFMTGLARLAASRETFSETMGWTDTIPLAPGHYTVQIEKVGLTDPVDPSGLTMLTDFRVPGFDTNYQEYQPVPNLGPTAVSPGENPVADLFGPQDERTLVMVNGMTNLSIPELPITDALLLDLAAHLPQGMKVARLNIEFPRDSSAWDDWQRLTDSLTIDLFIRYGRDESGRTNALHQIIRGVETRGRVLRSNDGPYLAGEGFVWLMLSPDEHILLASISPGSMQVCRSEKPVNDATARAAPPIEPRVSTPLHYRIWGGDATVLDAPPADWPTPAETPATESTPETPPEDEP